jgi:hypothetical protein
LHGRKEKLMGTERRFCSICAWRGTCAKRFTVSKDASGRVHCPDFTRDLAIKDKDVDKIIQKVEGIESQEK